MLNTQNLKNKFLFYHRQRKFQLSVVDWTPNVDWVFILVVFLILIGVGGWFSHKTYNTVISEINDTETVFVPRRRDVDFEQIDSLRKEYENRAEVLNSLE